MINPVQKPFTQVRNAEQMEKAVNSSLTSRVSFFRTICPPQLFDRVIRCLVFFTFFVCLPAHSVQHLRMGYIEFPPHYYTDENGAAGGLLIDLVKSLARQSGYTISFHSYPANRLVHYLVAGKLDLFIGLKTLPQFMEAALISDVVVGKLFMRIYSKTPLSHESHKEDLIGKRVLIIRGYSYGDWLRYMKDPVNNVDIRIADTHLQALNMINQRPIDYLLDYKLPIIHASQNLEFPDLFFNDIDSYGLHIIISKKSLNGEKALTALVNAYQTLFPEENNRAPIKTEN